jgi:hypothetical protein
MARFSSATLIVSLIVGMALFCSTSNLMADYTNDVKIDVYLATGDVTITLTSDLTNTDHLSLVGYQLQSKSSPGDLNQDELISLATTTGTPNWTILANGESTSPGHGATGAPAGTLIAEASMSSSGGAGGGIAGSSTDQTYLLGRLVNTATFVTDAGDPMNNNHSNSLVFSWLGGGDANTTHYVGNGLITYHPGAIPGVPEPSTFALLIGAALVGGVTLVRRRRG